MTVSNISAWNKNKKRSNYIVLFLTKEKQASDWSMATPCAHAQLIDIYVSCRAVTGMCCSSQPEPALTDQGRHRERCNSRSRARRTVLATFGKLLRFFQKSLDLSLGVFFFKVAKGVWKVAKSSNKVAKLATLGAPAASYTHAVISGSWMQWSHANVHWLV